MEIVYNRHNVGGSNFHLQFTPKYRRDVFRVRIVRKMIEALMRNKAHKLGVTLEAIEFGPDHVHLFVTNCRKYSVTQLANHLKGFSSWYIRRNLWDEIKPYLWGDSFWTDGFFYESIGRVTTNTIKFYIERQQGKHWMHSDPETIERKSSPQIQRTLESFSI
jgi:putative transposase